VFDELETRYLPALFERFPVGFLLTRPRTREAVTSRHMRFL